MRVVAQLPECLQIADAMQGAHGVDLQVLDQGFLKAWVVVVGVVQDLEVHGQHLLLLVDFQDRLGDFYVVFGHS